MKGKRILVPIDLEQNSFDGLEFVAGLAAETPVFATLLYVVNLNVSPMDRRVRDDLCRENEWRLREAAKAFFNNQLPHIRVRLGKPHEEILAEAAEGRAELIVMATPRTTRQKWRFGQTTVERVVRDAPCLTLVLPRIWKITPAQYRQSLRPATVAPDEAGSLCS